MVYLSHMFSVLFCSIFVSYTVDAIQSLKLAFLQDWRADWNDGENPDAQFRAGLQIPPEGAVHFIQATSSQTVLVCIISDLMNYLPTSCSGPDLADSRLIDYLITVDYPFHPDEVRHIELKFGIKFKKFESYLHNPRSLRHLARASIRRSCRYNVHYTLHNLPHVPNTLKQYVTIPEPLQ